MKTYVYPAVLYSGDDGFEYLSLPDLNLLTVGDTTEETFVKGRQSLISYFELATRFDTEIPEPSSFDDIKKQSIMPRLRIYTPLRQELLYTCCKHLSSFSKA